MGSVALQRALIAAGKADATWTLVPKNEWDVADRVALVRAAGGMALRTDKKEPRFNPASTLLPGLFAGPAPLHRDFVRVVEAKGTSEG